MCNNINDNKWNESNNNESNNDNEILMIMWKW